MFIKVKKKLKITEGIANGGKLTVLSSHMAALRNFLNLQFFGGGIE